MIINRITKQNIKDTIKGEKIRLKEYKSNEYSIPENWSIKEQRAFIMGMEYILQNIRIEENK